MKLFNITLISIVLGSLLIELNAAIKRITKRKSKDGDGCYAPAEWNEVKVDLTKCPSNTADKYQLNPANDAKKYMEECLHPDYVTKTLDDKISKKNGREATTKCQQMNRFDYEYSVAGYALTTGSDPLNYLNSAKFAGSLESQNGESLYNSKKPSGGFIVATNAPIGSFTETKKFYGKDGMTSPNKEETAKLKKGSKYESCPTGDWGTKENWKCYSGREAGWTNKDPKIDYKKTSGEKMIETTIDSFYHNLEKFNVKNIVMLTNFVERQNVGEDCKCKVKADQYFADKKGVFKTLGGKLINTETMTTDAKYPKTEIRKLHYKKHQMTHYHFKGWLDYGVPDFNDIKPLMELIIKKKKAGENTIVHCTGGIGRTGTFITSVLLGDLKKKDKFNLAKFIFELRKQRPSFVETAGQVEIVVKSIKAFSS